jgi:hypothetical protein
MNSYDRITTVTEFMSNRMAEIGKTPDDVARDLGFASPNAVLMVLKGKMKLPIDCVGALAAALDVDAAHLLRLVLREYDHVLLDAIEGILQRPLITAREAALIDSFRTVVGDRDVRSVVIERDGLLELIVLQDG